MKSKGLKRVIILGAATLAGIIIFQVNWVYNAYTLTDQQFTQTIKIALIDVAESIAEFNDSQLPSRQPIKQLSSNYFIVELNDQITPQLLEHYLIQEFETHNINLDFEYSIYDCETDEMVYGKSVNLNEKHRKYRNSPTFEKIEQFTYYFGIRFPSKTLFVLQKTNTWVISTFILLATIAFYAYSLLVISRQKKLSRIQKDFINNMAHEFKTPISTISISSNYIKQNSNEHKIKKYGNIIDIQNRKLEKQIENILTASMIESHKIKLNKEPINPLAIIEQVIESLQPRLHETGGFINIVESSGIPQINADSFHFSNVVFNILENAIKFTHGIPEISIQFIVCNKNIHLIIEDNGIGIQKKYWRKIFKKFYRISEENRHNTKGFGIGLNYVKNIVRAHKWKINLSSKPNKGTTFKLIMPII